MANGAYNRGKVHLADYLWTTDAEDLGVLLVTSSYVFNKDHNLVSDVVAFEVSGPGYGRRTVAAVDRSVIQDDTADASIRTIADGSITWTALNVGTDLRPVLFFINGIDVDDNSNELLGYLDTGSNIPVDTTGSDYALNFGPNGTIRSLG